MARGALLSKLARDDPVSIWMCLDGWSAATTSYIGAEICELLSLNDIKFRFLKSPVYISNWRRVKLVLGCLVMEERHTGEKMADFVEALCETWRIRSKLHGLVTDTASNMLVMARCLDGIDWAGCLNHILQLVVNDNIMERSNVPAVINTCKSLASAYHSSINFSKAVHVAQIQVQQRPEHALPWALAQSVSTRWNSEYICMRSILKSEAAIRQVLASGEFQSMKSLANVKLGQTQVDLLQNICAVLEPFYQATLQLSNDAACISETVPIITQLKESLGKVSESDKGVKSLKRDMMESLERRTGDFERSPGSSWLSDERRRDKRS